MTQCPVGQGGFFYGTLTCGDRQFRWIYDCGSKNTLTTQLKREINDKVSKNCIVDALYFSHLHNDHISGIDYLLSRCKVKQIVLPYLNESDKYFTLLHHFFLLNNGEISDTQFDLSHEFIMNTVKFCSERGIEKLIQVREATPRPEDDDRDESVVESFEDFVPSEDDGLVDIWHPKLESDLSVGGDSGSGTEVYISAADASASVSIREFTFGWEFVPYVHPIPKRERNKFVRRINQIIGRGQGHTPDSREIYKLADTKDKLENLLEFYKDILSVVNPLSMSLYTGPKFNIGGRRFSISGSTVLFNGRASYEDSESIMKIFIDKKMISMEDSKQIFRDTNGLEGGWILTGDSDFKKSNRLGSGRSRFDGFRNRYEQYRPSINVVMVPHHGSKNNVTHDFFNFFENPFVSYAAAGPTRHHPSQDVVCMACATSGPFHVVGKDPVSELTLRSEWQFH